MTIPVYMFYSCLYIDDNYVIPVGEPQAYALYSLVNIFQRNRMLPMR